MTKSLSALAASLVLGAFAPSASQAQALQSDTLDKVVAVVEEDVILQSELDRSVSNVLSQFAGRTQQLPPRDVIEKQVLDRLILNRLQVERAEGTGIRVSDAEVDQAAMQ